MIRTITFIGWLLVSQIFKIPAYFSFGIGLAILFLSSLAIIMDHQGIALRLTTYAFGFIVIGCISYIRLPNKNEKK